MLKTIGLLGGTFDPIHKGHILSAVELKQRLLLDEMRLLPCHLPPHRASLGGSSRQRLQMVTLAVELAQQLQVDDREIQRNTVSYTVDTLEQLRGELGNDVSLCWVLGTDAFATLDKWHRWQELLTLAHLLVITRPDTVLPAEGAVAQLIQEHKKDNVELLKTQPCGSIRFESLNPYPVSATAIRDAVHSYYQNAKTQSLLCDDAFLQSVLTQPVLNYINEHKLYC